MKPTAPDPDALPELRSALLAYYDREARDLPWRRDRDPYRILVSEIMLQQTRVDTVLGYYDDWLKRFPTMDALASAKEEEVLKAWEGLGYYRRARNLHAAARAVRERGGLPRSSDALRALPGVGEYTAGAVASIAFDEVTPAVDGNVRRVLSRLYDEPDPGAAWLRSRAGALVDRDRPGDWNQALMELGATVCTPRAPQCDVCPASTWCGARGAGTVADRPATKKAKAVARGRFVLAVAERGGRVLVQRRPPGGLLGGLWAFPEARVDGEAELTAEAATDAARRVASDIARDIGLEVVEDAHSVLPAVVHRFSHLDATYFPVVLRVGRSESPDGRARGDPNAAGAPLRWIAPDDSETPLPVAQRKVLEAWRGARGEEAV